MSVGSPLCFGDLWIKTFRHPSSQLSIMPWVEHNGYGYWNFETEEEMESVFPTGECIRCHDRVLLSQFEWCTLCGEQYCSQCMMREVEGEDQVCCRCDELGEYLLPFVFLLWVTIGMDIREQQLAG